MVAAVLVLGATAACDYTGRPGGVRISVVGESIAGGAEAELRRDLGEERLVHTMLINHRHIRQIGVFLPQIVANPDLRILVVQLGVNDSAEKRTVTQIRADMRAFLRVAAPAVECVWWLDIKERVLTQNPVYDDMAPRFNRILHEEAARYPNVHVGGFDAWASARPQYLGKDGLHLSGAGRVAFTNWVEDHLVAAC